MIRKYFSLLIVGGYFLISTHEHVLAQCCSLGSPMAGGTSLGVTKTGYLKAVSIYRYGLSNKYLKGSQAIDSSAYFVNTTYYDFIGFNISYGIEPKFSVEIEAGYYVDKTQIYNEEDVKRLGLVSSEKASGLNDPALILKYSIYKKEGKQIELTVGTGYKIPTGNYLLKNPAGNKILARDVQPGTGAHSILATFFAYKGFPSIKLKTFLNARAEFSSYNPDHFKFGNLYLVSLVATYSLTPALTAVLQVRNENKAIDKAIDMLGGNLKYYSSGYHKILITPQLTYTLSQKWLIGAMWDWPAYQYYYGTQLATAYSFAFTLTREFKVKKDKEPQTPIQ